MDFLDPWSWSEHTLRVLTALGTTGAVIALVLVETTKGLRRAWAEHRRRPELTLAHDSEIDRTSEIGFHPQQPPTAGPMRMVYLRLAVRNKKGRRAADGVEVSIVRVEQLDGHDNDRLPAHNMGPLTWSHRDPLQSRLGPGAASSAAIGYGFTGVNDLRFFIDLGVPWPNSRVNILGIGTYRFTLRVTAANADAEDWTITVANAPMTAPDGSPEHTLTVTEGPRRLRAVEARREQQHIDSAEERALPKPEE
jgi:hypothetical protein